MTCCNSNCVCLAVILGIISGVILGVLYALGFVATGIIFWVYLVFGVLAVFLSPLYARRGDGCFCKFRRLLLTAAVGSIISAAIGLIVATVASTTVVGIVLGIATLFIVMLIISVICLVNCLCCD